MDPRYRSFSSTLLLYLRSTLLLSVLVSSLSLVSTSPTRASPLTTKLQHSSALALHSQNQPRLLQGLRAANSAGVGRCGCKLGDIWCGMDGKNYSSMCEVVCLWATPTYKRVCTNNEPMPTCRQACAGRAGMAPARPGACGAATECSLPKFNMKLLPTARAKFPSAKYPLCAYTEDRCRWECERVRGRLYNAFDVYTPQQAEGNYTRCIHRCFGVDKAPCPRTVVVALEVGKDPLCTTAPSLYCGVPFRDGDGVLKAYSRREPFASWVARSAA